MSRIAFVLAACLLLAACGAPQTPERPREGAQPNAPGPTARPAESNAGPPPTLAPPTAASSPTTLAQGPDAAPSLSPSPIPGFVIVATDGAGANVRTGPSTGAPVVTTLREGTSVEVIGDPVNAEGRAWRRIRSGDKEGWVVAVVVRQR
jgi:hypothetical protein